MQLLEIVRADQTSAQTVMDLLSLAKTLNKVPLIVKDVPGFAANRLFVPYLMLSTFIVDLGLDPYRIDAVIKDFGMPMGPFRVADFTGIKTFHLVSQTLFANSPDSFYRSPLIELLLKDGREGIATRKGFYNYGNVKQGEEAPELQRYLEASRQIVLVRDADKGIEDISDTEIVEMIFFGVANEACKIVEDNVVTGTTALDVASVYGMGFPPYRGGIFFWADSKGPIYILNQLKKWSRKYGAIYKPSSHLETCAASNSPLGTIVSRSSRL
ncbi:hypothetical protein L7F22_057268 [Adiantum nelumboides]|nr:hypothetical protein [Adiantum nelumboides]